MNTLFYLPSIILSEFYYNKGEELIKGHKNIWRSYEVLDIIYSENK